jgi:hypothetical protein
MIKLAWHSPINFQDQKYKTPHLKDFLNKFLIFLLERFSEQNPALALRFVPSKKESLNLTP